MLFKSLNKSKKNTANGFFFVSVLPCCYGTLRGVRTLDTGVRGQRPRPLDYKGVP